MRHVSCRPRADFFKPAGISCQALETVTLTLDEVEALRLADLEGLYQAQAAELMKISRQTFARIVEEARRKTADALIHGKALRLEGGTVTVREAANLPSSDKTGSGQVRCSCGCGRRRGCAAKSSVSENGGKDAK
jgi:hypothetical protein